MAISYFDFAANITRRQASLLLDCAALTENAVQTVTEIALAMRRELEEAAYLEPHIARARKHQIHERLQVCQDVLRDVEAR